jgi:hypothetical protein
MVKQMNIKCQVGKFYQVECNNKAVTVSNGIMVCRKHATMIRQWVEDNSKGKIQQ